MQKQWQTPLHRASFTSLITILSIVLWTASGELGIVALSSQLGAQAADPCVADRIAMIDSITGHIVTIICTDNWLHDCNHRRFIYDRSPTRFFAQALI